MRIHKENQQRIYTISPSSLNSYFQCPYNHYLHYTKELQELPNFNFIRGTGLHYSLEMYFKEKKTVDQCVNLGKEKLKSLFSKLQEKQVKMNIEPEDQEELKKYLEFYDYVIPRYIEEIGQYLDCMYSEKEMSFTVSKSKTKKIESRGFIDLVAVAKKDLEKYNIKKNDIIIIDFKTAKRSGKPYLQNKLQLELYRKYFQESIDPYADLKLQIHKFIMRDLTKTRKKITGIFEVHTLEHDQYLYDLIVPLCKQITSSHVKKHYPPTGIYSTFGCINCTNRNNCKFAIVNK